MTVRGADHPDAPRFDPDPRSYDAVLVMSFGGPEGPDDVLPFLENVTRGRNIPRDRLHAVAEHYAHFGGVSPLNAQNRALIAALDRELRAHGHDLPIYFGNRNWHPLITDTMRRMRDDGVQRAVAFVTSGFSSWSGCRQYREDIVRAQDAAPGAPAVDKLRVFFNHPGFIAANADHLRATLERFPADRRGGVHVGFTAHSIPVAMARNAAYAAQLEEAARLVAGAAGVTRWRVVYQSRSGPPEVPWLEPDVLDHLDALAADGVQDVVLLPLGFLSDHMEVRYDLDVEARARADALGLRLERAPTVGTAAPFVQMIRELIEERMQAAPERPALGRLGPGHDVCPLTCCLPGSAPRR